jgi:hypothetical protein
MGRMEMVNRVGISIIVKIGIVLECGKEKEQKSYLDRNGNNNSFLYDPDAANFACPAKSIHPISRSSTIQDAYESSYNDNNQEQLEIQRRKKRRV